MTELIELILRHQGVLAQNAVALTVVFLRVGAVMATLPVFGEQVVPPRIRLVLALMFTAAIAPAVIPGMPDLSLESSFAPEIIIGLGLGISLRLFVLAMMTAGTIAANATSLSQLFPNGAEPQPAISQLLVMAGLAFALVQGLHLRIVGFLIQSYDVLPAGAWPDAAAFAHWGIGQISRAFSLGFMIAMPFVIASVIYNVALGVINRAMPQLMVSLVGAPALSLGGLGLLVLVAPLAISVWHAAFVGFIAAPLGSPP